MNFTSRILILFLIVTMSEEKEKNTSENGENDANIVLYEKIFEYNALGEEELIPHIEQYMWVESLEIYKQGDSNFYQFWVYLYDRCMDLFYGQLPSTTERDTLTIIKRRIGWLRVLKLGLMTRWKICCVRRTKKTKKWTKM